MRPGRELDKLIAEKVMGILPDFDEGIYYYDGHADPLQYSTNIAAAWDVVDKLNSNFDMALETHFDGWLCDFGNNPSNRATGITAPHAICLAALNAVGAS